MIKYLSRSKPHTEERRGEGRSEYHPFYNLFLLLVTVSLVIVFRVQEKVD